MDELKKLIDEQWQRLCEECDRLRDEYFKTLADAPNFMKTDHPTKEELAVYAAESRWEACKRRMKEFKKTHFQPEEL